MKRCLIEEMLQSNELERMLRDSYANYVIQTAMDFADADTKARLVENIRPILPAIRSTPYGRRIQGKIQALDSRSGASSGQITPNDGSAPGQIPLSGRQSLSNGSTPHRRQSSAFSHSTTFGSPSIGGIGGSPGSGLFGNGSGYDTPIASGTNIDGMMRGSTSAVSVLSSPNANTNGNPSQVASVNQPVRFKDNDNDHTLSFPNMSQNHGQTGFAHQSYPSTDAAGLGQASQQSGVSGSGGAGSYYF